MLLFFSPTGVKALKKNFPDFVQGDIAIGAFGAATSQAVTNEGLRLDLSAPSPKHHSMTGALSEFLQNQSNEQ